MITCDGCEKPLEQLFALGFDGYCLCKDCYDTTRPIYVSLKYLIEGPIKKALTKRKDKINESIKTNC